MNDAPVAVNDGGLTQEDQAIQLSILSNDYDVDGVLVLGSVNVLSPAVNGSLSVNVATGTVTYTPDAGYNGLDSFSYTVSDDLGAVSNTGWVYIEVTDINDGPVAVNDAAVLDEDTSVLIGVLGNDYDIDGVLDSGSVSLVQGPVWGSVSVDRVSGEILYTPDPGYSGSDNFSYVVYDTDAAVSNSGYVSVYINAVNDVPVAVNDVGTTYEDQALEVLVLLNDYDVDGPLDVSSVSVVLGAVHGL